MPSRGVNLVQAGGKWMFRTAADLCLASCHGRGRGQATVARGARNAGDRRLSPAGDARRNRGYSRRRDLQGNARPSPRNRLGAAARPQARARPSDHIWDDGDFLIHFGLEAIGDLPGLEELKGAGLFDGRLPQGFGIPQPSDGAELADDEDPLEDEAANGCFGA